MARTASISAGLLAVLTATLVAAAASAAPGRRTRAPASVRVVECQQSDEAGPRSGAFYARMGTVPGTRRMALRITLQERTGDESWQKLAAPGLGIWHSSKPGVRRFGYRQDVQAMAPATAYRVVVHFRWYDRRGNTVRRAKRRSGPCRQPGLLPNLQIAHIGGRPMPRARGAERYFVQVVNRGRTPVIGFTVSLAVDGAEVNRVTLGTTLLPGGSAGVPFTGPVCRSQVTAVVDPLDAVKERRERDNALSVPCPLQ